VRDRETGDLISLHSFLESRLKIITPIYKNNNNNKNTNNENNGIIIIIIN
jgi:hypothetical protein